MSKKAKKQPDSFPLSLGEYVSGIKKPETRAAFKVVVKKSGLGIGQKQRAVWDKMLEVFLSMPVGADLKNMFEKGRN